MPRPQLEVVAAVLRDPRGRVLIAERPAGKALAGRWEFPGGKREPGESAEVALERELREELGLELLRCTPLINIRHDYPERTVRMETFTVDAWCGVPHPHEDQAIAWVAPGDLPRWDILEADAPIIAALRLPDRLLVTPEPDAHVPIDAFLARLARSLDGGARMVQLRAKSLEPGAYRALAIEAQALCRARGADLLLNADPALADALGAAGVHLDGARLAALGARPLGADRWVSASVHDAASLERARALGVDFAVLGPVRETATHAGVPLGWDGFAALARDAGLPVFAIGGLRPADIPVARAHGAQGIAAIRGLWRSD